MVGDYNIGFSLHFQHIDGVPATNSRGLLQTWLGLDEGESWTHSGQPVTFTNWKEQTHALHTTLSYGSWIWWSHWTASEKCGFICEKNI